MVLKWQGGIDEMSLKRHEVQPLKCLKHSIFSSNVVWSGREINNVNLMLN